MKGEERMGRAERQNDYRHIPLSVPIVIDNGAFSCRVGWAGESDPRFVFRNILQRPRLKTSGELVNIVGDLDPPMAKYFDFTRSSYKSAFDGNVVFQFEILEHIFDYTFDRLGVESMEVEHPVLVTECPCNPIYSRSKMAELLFESYGVPSLAFGVDAIFSYKYNQSLGKCESDGLVVSSGYTSTHTIPIVGGEPVLEACCRANIGGFQVTDYMKRLLSLQYPYHIGSLTWEKVEELKIEHAYIAKDYSSELQLFQKGTKEAEEKTWCWQLHWVPPPTEEQPSEEDIARKAAMREKQSQRLREMAATKRSNKIADLESEIQSLEQLLQDIEGADDELECRNILLESGFSSKNEVESALSKDFLSLRKVKGEPLKSDKELEREADIPLSEKYPLLDVPNEMLTAEQLKEKKKQIFLKSTSEGRARAKQKKQVEELQRERDMQLEEERRLANPEQYLEELRGRQAELVSRVEQRKRQKVNGGSATLINGSNSISSAGGRGERLNAAQKERMKLLTTAAFDRGKDEDTFGQNEEDWQLYKKMGKDNDDENELDEDELELNKINTRLQDLDPSFNPLVGNGISQVPAESQLNRLLKAEDFQIKLGIERFRCPEILFQPSIIGIDQSGLDEIIDVSVKRLPDDFAKGVLEGTILLTGGSSLFDGLDNRLHLELKKCRPLGATIKIVRASDALLDAWRGASFFADASFPYYAFTKADYEENGEDRLRRYNIKYAFP